MKKKTSAAVEYIFFNSLYIWHKLPYEIVEEIYRLTMLHSCFFTMMSQHNESYCKQPHTKQDYNGGVFAMLHRGLRNNVTEHCYLAMIVFHTRWQLPVMKHDNQVASPLFAVYFSNVLDIIVATVTLKRV